MLSISPQHATSGEKSLKIEIYPSKYPGLRFTGFDPDWSNYNALLFDVYNPNNFVIELLIRIDDKKDPSYRERFNTSKSIKQGYNFMKIYMGDLIMSGDRKSLSLSKINNVMFFFANPAKNLTLYLDNIRLTKKMQMESSLGIEEAGTGKARKRFWQQKWG